MSRRANNRDEQLLAAAAKVFRHKGYPATTMRDIATASGMSAGSIYYHHRSKGDLLLAVYGTGVQQVITAVEQAIDRSAAPWQRLERAMAAHLEMLLASHAPMADFAGVFVQVLPRDFPPAQRQRLVAQRDAYEARFRVLIDALPLPRGTDRRLLRLHLIGALNHVPTWYRPGGAKTPAAIARAFTRQLRQTLDESDP